MIKVYKFQKLGHFDHGWLDTRHHFSFASYWDPTRVGFGALLVINDDKISPNKGFGEHGHKNMEIITYVRQGAITHKDSLGNLGKTMAGDVQVMSAGSGVVHAEYNLEQEDTLLYQIWIKPNVQDVAPRWDAKVFPKLHKSKLTVLVSGQPEHEHLDALKIYQDAAIYCGTFSAGMTTVQPIKHQAYILASKGDLSVNGVSLSQADGAEVTQEKVLSITAKTDCEVLVIDVPAV